MNTLPGTVYPGRLHSCGRTRVELRSNSTHPETAPSQAFRRGVKRSHDMRFAPQGCSANRPIATHPKPRFGGVFHWARHTEA
ncbi:Ferredoxin [Pseudomonas syringae pv. actinidiae]|uniref:Ferredoxin n=1 Tax=Pseudomonas syringae pv. actinidiae TaxID=103796 RepID=A0A2V0Q9V3_PSESF|nr:Ferredoxin [Pseudomonas syringae pv. actinidiae]